MNRLNIATRGICSWRERLTNPDRQWRRRYSAFEAAVSWEAAATTESALPEPIRALLDSVFGAPRLLLAVAEDTDRMSRPRCQSTTASSTRNDTTFC